MSLATFLTKLEALDDDKLAGALPVVLLMFVPLLGDTPLPGALAENLARFERSLGLAEGASDDDKRAAMQRHMKQHGLEGALWRDLLAALKEGPLAVAAAAKLLASERVTGALQRTAPPPAGTVGAGPFARFSVGGALDAKKPR